MKRNYSIYLITHYVNGLPVKSKAIIKDDAFYQIVEGKWTGNLVHCWDVKDFEKTNKELDVENMPVNKYEKIFC